MKFTSGTWVELSPNSTLRKMKGFTKGKVKENQIDEQGSVLVRFMEAHDDMDTYWCDPEELIECADPYIVDRNAKFEEWQKTEERMKQRRDEMLAKVFGHEPKEEKKEELNAWDITKWITFLRTAPIDQVGDKLRSLHCGWSRRRYTAYTPFGKAAEGEAWPNDTARVWWDAYVERARSNPRLYHLFD